MKIIPWTKKNYLVKTHFPMCTWKFVAVPSLLLFHRINNREVAIKSSKFGEFYITNKECGVETFT